MRPYLFALTIGGLLCSSGGSGGAGTTSQGDSSGAGPTGSATGTSTGVTTGTTGAQPTSSTDGSYD